MKSITTIIAASVILTLSSRSLAQPLVSHVTEPALPGCHVVITGDGFSDATNVQVEWGRLADEAVKSYDPAALPKPAGIQSVAPAVRTAQTLTVPVPIDRYGVCALRVVADGKAGPWFMVNRPDLRWSLGQSAAPGQALRLQGRWLVDLNRYPTALARNRGANRDNPGGGFSELTEHNTVVLLQTSDGKSIVLPAEAPANAYSLTARLPDTLPSGDATLRVHSGIGGAAAWSAPLKVRIATKASWPTEVFNVRDYGAVGDAAADDTASIKAALHAVEENGGGILLLPPGSYLVSETIVIPAKTIVRGASRERTWIWCPDGVQRGERRDGKPLLVVLAGDRDFVVEDLTIHGVYAQSLIQAPVTIIEEGRRLSHHLADGPPAENVTIRRCRLITQPMLVHHRRRNDPFLTQEQMDTHSSVFRHWYTVAVRGTNVSITDNHIRAGGTCIGLKGVTDALVADNLLEHRSVAVYHYPSYVRRHGQAEVDDERLLAFNNPPVVPARTIIERNTMRPVSSVPDGSIRGGPESKDFYIAHNDISLSWERDSESILYHSWGLRFTASLTDADANSVTADVGSIPIPLMDRIHQKTMQFYVDPAKNAFHDGHLKNFQVLVIEGPGLGQLRQVTGNDGNRITVDRPWNVVPRAGSVIALCEFENFAGDVVAGNTLTFTGPAIHFWGNGYDAVLDGNTMIRSGGIRLDDLGHKDSKTGTNWAGSFYILAINNHLDEGRFHRTVDANEVDREFFGVIGWRPNNSVGIANLGWVARGNLVTNDGMITSVVRNSLGEGTLIERNMFSHSQRGIEVGTWISALVANNSFTDVEIPLIVPEESKGRILVAEPDIRSVISARRALFSLPPIGDDVAVDYGDLFNVEKVFAGIQRASQTETIRLLEPNQLAMDISAATSQIREALEKGATADQLTVNMTVELPKGFPKATLRPTFRLPESWQIEAPEEIAIAPGRNPLTLKVTPPAQTVGDLRIWAGMDIFLDELNRCIRVPWYNDIDGGGLDQWLVSPAYGANESNPVVQTETDADGQTSTKIASDLSAVDWQTLVSPEPDLGKLHGFKPDSARRVYLLTALDSSREAKATIPLPYDGTNVAYLHLPWDRKMRIWLNGTKVEPMGFVPRSGSVDVTLKEGRNLLLIELRQHSTDYKWNLKPELDITLQGDLNVKKVPAEELLKSLN